MSQKQLVYIAHGSSHFFGAERSSFNIQGEQNWTENGHLGHTHCPWEGVGKDTANPDNLLV